MLRQVVRKLYLMCQMQWKLLGIVQQQKQRLDNRKITELGFKARYDIETGISRTLKIMEE